MNPHCASGNNLDTFTLVFQVSPAPRNIHLFMKVGYLLIRDLAAPPCLLLTVVTVLHMLLVHSIGKSQDVYIRCFSLICFIASECLKDRLHIRQWTPFLSPIHCLSRKLLLGSALPLVLHIQGKSLPTTRHNMLIHVMVVSSYFPPGPPPSG